MQTQTVLVDDAEPSFFSSKGRIRRRTFWLRIILLNVLLRVVILGITFTAKEMYSDTAESVAAVALLLVCLAALILMIIQSIKRMHDVDKSGWYYLIPLYNLILCCTEGTEGDNE